MSQNQLLRSAVGGIDIRDLFKPISHSEYANRTVFSPPIPQESAMLRAIEAIRQGTSSAPPASESPQPMKAEDSQP